MRRLIFILIGLVAMLAAACGGGGGDAGRQPAPTAADSPNTTPAGQVVELPCEVPDDIKSFRFTFATKMDVPGRELEEAVEEVLQVAMDAAQQEGQDLFAESNEGWGALVFWFLASVDMRMEGAVVLPDRAETEIRMRYLEVEATVITIGDREWTKGGALDWEESVAAEPEGLTWRRGLTDLCEVFTLSDVAGLEPREETVNGVATLHYRLDGDDFTRLRVAELLAGDAEEMWDVGDMAQQGTIDLWLAKEGNWPVRLEMEFTLDYGEIRDLSGSMFMEVKDLNDPSIKIEPPRG